MHDDRPLAFCKPVRRDGKIPVRFVYRVSGARLNKLLTAEEFAALKAEGKYAIYADSGSTQRRWEPRGLESNGGAI